jgi:hypothetical protein
MFPKIKPRGRKTKCPDCGHTYRSDEAHPKAKCQLFQATSKQSDHKYGAVKTVCSAGHPHPSGLECAVCEILMQRERAGDIRDLKWQCTVDLGFGVRWKVDWGFEQKSGQLLTDPLGVSKSKEWIPTYAEAKGAETKDYKLKLRMWKDGRGPAPLEIWKGSAQRPTLVETIHPKSPPPRTLEQLEERIRELVTSLRLIQSIAYKYPPAIACREIIGKVDDTLQEKLPFGDGKHG